jgi:CMP-N,N'-diacetyllegionaminic acid synthase
MKTIATICARGGSVGLPRKNILDFCGKPLIAHTIEQALQCDFIDDVYVSTDNEEIAQIARQYGAKVPFMRPSHLATAEAGKIPVLQHCLDFFLNKNEKVSKLIDLQPTSPLRNTEDIKGCYDLLTEDVDVVFSVCESHHNPYFSMVEINAKGHAHLSKTWGAYVVRRQDAPKVYALNGAIYVWHAHALEKGLWDGDSKIYIMPKERSIDIDDHYDFLYAELLYSNYPKMSVSDLSNFEGTPTPLAIEQIPTQGEDWKLKANQKSIKTTFSVSLGMCRDKSQ